MTFLLGTTQTRLQWPQSYFFYSRMWANWTGNISNVVQLTFNMKKLCHVLGQFDEHFPPRTNFEMFWFVYQVKSRTESCLGCRTGGFLRRRLVCKHIASNILIDFHNKVFSVKGWMTKKLRLFWVIYGSSSIIKGFCFLIKIGTR